MKISQSSWNRYIEKLSAINAKAGKLMQKWMLEHPNADTAEMIDYAYAVASRYGEASASLACEMYDATAAVQGARVPAAEPAQTATYTETGIAVNGAKLRGDAIVPQAVERLVKMAGQDTLLNNSLRDGAEWAWVPMGDTCAFCITLASRGWQKASKKAIKGGHAEHIHSHCDCSYAIRFDGKSTIDGYDPDEYLRQYNEAGGDINAMRRANYAANKNIINIQKRLAYNNRLPEIIELDDVRLRNSVGAKAKSYNIVDRSTGVTYYLVENTSITKVEVFAGNGVRNKLDPAVAEGVARYFGARARSIQHVKGIALLQDENYMYMPQWAEIHWFQVKGGKKDKFVVKRWLEDYEIPEY